MAQIFRPRATLILRGAIVGVAVAVVVAVLAGYAVSFSDRGWGVGVAPPQPVPFSHAHHVGGLGIDCRYCHSSVERAAYAGMPSAQTCMSCHSQVWTAASVLAPIQGSYATGEPMAWTRVHDLPDHARFHHGIHVAKGIGCETCHGRIDRMDVVAKTETLSMRWCLDCHRAPERHVRPREEVFTMGWTGHSEGPALVEQYGIEAGQLTDCSVCHY